MFKINSSTKSVENELSRTEFTLSLYKGCNFGDFTNDEYVVISETPSSMAVLPVGRNLGLARFLFDLFLAENLLPANIESIISDYGI